MRPLLVATLTVMILALSPAWATTIHVPADQPTIQAGVDAAAPGDTVVIASGTYYEHSINISIPLCLRSETGQPESVIIDAGGLGRVVTLGCYDDPSLVEGLTLTGGVAPYVSVQARHLGGGLFARGYGSAGATTSTIRNCVFLGNYSEDDGGGLGARYCEPILEGCRFIANVGDGASCWSATVIDCEFSNNEPYGLRFRAGSTLEGCLFSGNTGRGGLWCSGGYWEPDLYVQECTFTGNQGGQGAGAECHFQVHAWFTDCVFESNTASDSGGGVMVDYESRAAFEGCTFVGNSAPIGAGLFVRYYSFARLFRCTVSDNSASAASGAVDVALDSEATVNRTIVAHSTTGCAISIDSSSDGWAACSDLFGNADGDWVGVIGDYSGLDGNISADPLFCGDALPATPYALDASSPCTGWANPQCQLVGAWHIGCGSTAAEQMSWGAIKGLFR